MTRLAIHHIAFQRLLAIRRHGMRDANCAQQRLRCFSLLIILEGGLWTTTPPPLWNAFICFSFICNSIFLLDDDTNLIRVPCCCQSVKEERRVGRTNNFRNPGLAYRVVQRRASRVRPSTPSILRLQRERLGGEQVPTLGRRRPSSCGVFIFFLSLYLQRHRMSGLPYHTTSFLKSQAKSPRRPRDLKAICLHFTNYPPRSVLARD